MKIAAAVVLVAASMVDVAAPAQAAPNICFVAAKRYRHRLDYEPPPFCWGTVWFSATDGHWNHPLPFGQDQGTRPPTTCSAS
jgi:hypothetical protein